MKIVKKAGLSSKIKSIIKDVDSSALRVGWGENQRYDDKERTPVAMVAASNEFGNPARSVPPRPFLRPAIMANKNNWKAQIMGGMKMVFSDKISVSQVFEAVGMLVVGDVQKQITKTTSPALAKSTIKKRLSGKKVGNMTTATKPLEDTGYMRASITHEEVKK